MVASNTRLGRAKLNIIYSLIGQFVTLLCGIIVPRLLIGAFGSEAYGATASIAQFLSYITLLEGGIGGVARAALYKPLAENDTKTISEITHDIKRFFRIIAYIFIVYVLVLACFYKKLSHIDSIDWISTFLLVIVISLSTFSEYFIGISYTVLVQAAQKSYITTALTIMSKIINTIIIIFLVFCGSNLVVVKLVSSCIYVVKPIVLSIYVNKHFGIVKINYSTNHLKDKWAGLAQHIAYFLHSNTDIAILTVLGDLKMVAVYSVYNMIVLQIQNVCSSFVNGMEALFGDMLAKKEIRNIHNVFNYYETLISIVSTILFSVTAIMIIPFVRIYTSGVNDANYIEPVFSLVLIFAAYIFCLRTPYHAMTIAAGHFKQTQIAAYSEAFINVFLSLVLVKTSGLLGVAIGTLVATVTRMIYYAIYLHKHIIMRSLIHFIKREVVNVFAFVLIVIVGIYFSDKWYCNNYFSWAGKALVVTVYSVSITFIVNIIFYRSNMIMLFKKAFVTRKK